MRSSELIITIITILIALFGYFRFIYVRPSTINSILDNIGMKARIIDSELHYFDKDSLDSSYKSYGYLSETSKNLKRIIENRELVTIIRTTNSNDVIVKDLSGNTYEVPARNIKLLDSPIS